MKALGLAAVLVLAGSGMAAAGTIERACLKSDRKAASRALCGCIQTVADKTLTRSDQRRAAKFFGDPHMAQEVRQSDRASDEAFWQKYKNFGATAQAFCG
jgi:hypothetical protein